MKKLAAILLAVVVLLSVSACGNKETIPDKTVITLTPENIGDYLWFSEETTGGTVTQEKGLQLGPLTLWNYRGNAQYTLKASAKTDAVFDGVSVKVRISVASSTLEDTNWQLAHGTDELRYHDGVSDEMVSVEYKTLQIASDGTGEVHVEATLDSSSSLPVSPFYDFKARYQIESVTGSVTVTNANVPSES